MKKKNKVLSKKGSFILEMAVTAPVFLILIIFVLHLITCIRTETLLMQAIDQVTAEIAAAAPLISAGEEVVQEAIQSMSGSAAVSDTTSSLIKEADGINAILAGLDVDAGDLIGTVLFGETIRNRIVSYYNLYKKENTIGKIDLISDLSVNLDIDNQEKVIYIHGHYKRNSLFGKQDRQIKSAVALFSPILEVIKEPKNDIDDKKNGVWELDNFQRGQILRKEHGGNLPSTYPVIARWDNNIATAIKSMDLTAPGYQNSGMVQKAIGEYLRELSSFEGTENPWGKDKINISSGMIQKKKLIVVIPGNYTISAYDELVSCETDAKNAGVEINWVIYGESQRYTDNKGNELNEE